ncbi:hypothetical protein M433DRAFT_308083, partial [Acidomyces richmondensis BFW]
MHRPPIRWVGILTVFSQSYIQIQSCRKLRGAADAKDEKETPKPVEQFVHTHPPETRNTYFFPLFFFPLPSPPTFPSSGTRLTTYPPSPTPCTTTSTCTPSSSPSPPLLLDPALPLPPLHCSNRPPTIVGSENPAYIAPERRERGRLAYLTSAATGALTFLLAPAPPCAAGKTPPGAGALLNDRFLLPPLIFNGDEEDEGGG